MNGLCYSTMGHIKKKTIIINVYSNLKYTLSDKWEITMRVVHALLLLYKHFSYPRVHTGLSVIGKQQRSSPKSGVEPHTHTHIG